MLNVIFTRMENQAVSNYSFFSSQMFRLANGSKLFYCCCLNESVIVVLYLLIWSVMLENLSNPAVRRSDWFENKRCGSLLITRFHAAASAKWHWVNTWCFSNKLEVYLFNLIGQVIVVSLFLANTWIHKGTSVIVDRISLSVFCA